MFMCRLGYVSELLQQEPIWAQTDVFEPDKAWWMSDILLLSLNHKEMVNNRKLSPHRGLDSEQSTTSV